ncbi:ICP22 family protein [Haladaptatus cibarius]|uniref:AAA family ATPase n=1 Tax=Haladaptatus cibarius TaxID=453847 RepID=UPI0006796F2B|nr:AAA family ATPase [Haladaptatus cibarius]
MSDFSSGNEVITRSDHGVTIEKSFDGEEFAVPAIRFEVRSDCDDAVTVRVTDRIPDDFPMDNVGFHPEYENENWTAYKDHRVQFERTLEPSEELTTVYGIRLTDWQDAESFLIEPELEEVAPVTNGASTETEGRMEEHTITDIVSEDSSQVVRDVIAGDSSGLPGLGDSGENTDPLADASTSDPLAEASSDPLAETADEPVSEAVESADAAEAADEPSTETAADPLSESTMGEEETESEAPFADDDGEILDESDESVDSPDSTDDVLAEPDDADILEPPAEDEAVEVEQSASPPRPGSVAAALADEIRAGEVSDADLKLIQQELDLDTPESTNVRIRHLQSRVDDLSAYTEALEEFIDDNGTAQTVIDGFECEVEALRDELGAMDDDIESAKDEGAQARARVADLETDLEELDGKLDGVDDLGNNLDTLDTQLNDLEDLVATNTQEASALDDEIEDLRDDFDNVDALENDIETLEKSVAEIETLTETVSDLSDSVSEAESELDDKIDSLRTDISAVESELNEIEELQSDISELEGELSELREWRDQLGSVFGGN